MGRSLTDNGRVEAKLTPTRLLAALIVAAGMLAAPAHAGGYLYLTAEAGSKVTFTDAGGRPVKKLRPGLYTLVVHDRSEQANVRIVGPGVRKATGTTYSGTTRWRVRFVRGTYRYRSDSKATNAATFLVG